MATMWRSLKRSIRRWRDDRVSRVTAMAKERPGPPAPSRNPTLSTYLFEHPKANLRVTEQAGRRYWVHAPRIEGDSLVGRRGYHVPPELGADLLMWRRQAMARQDRLRYIVHRFEPPGSTGDTVTVMVRASATGWQ